ncbi:hypothetical protein COHA_001751 [Chlorella ohadii]|uniref:Chitin-binding type-2 domain-containing protein n=1 Tax=Chlorella ohadii TaxID=2649997 RepID=A0AAD5DVY7_9CHLO|nr:hypothetical protein COHA_001751 [Chlorella ohadii]
MRAATFVVLSALLGLAAARGDRNPWKGWKNPCKDQPDGIAVATGGCSNEFVPCWHGRPAAIQQCPTGLVYNPWVQACVYPGAVGTHGCKCLKIYKRDKAQQVACEICRFKNELGNYPFPGDRKRYVECTMQGAFVRKCAGGRFSRHHDHTPLQRRTAAGWPLSGALANHGTATACFLELLGCDCRPMRETAAALLRSLAAAGPEAREHIAAVDGGIPALVAALQLPGCQMPAAHTLASLAAHSKVLQQAVFVAGAIPALTACLVSTRIALQHAAVTALVALCADCADSLAVLVATVNATHLAALVQLVHCNDPAAAHQATLLLRQLAGSSSAVQEQLAAEALAPPPAVEAGVFALLELIRRSRSAAEQLSAAEALGRLSQGSPAAQAALVAGDGVRVLLQRLCSSRPAMRRAAAVVLVQVALGGQAQLAVVQAEGGPNVLEHIQAGLMAEADGSAVPPDLPAAAQPQLAAPAPHAAVNCAPASPRRAQLGLPQQAVAGALRRAEVPPHGSEGDMASLMNGVSGLQLGNSQPAQYGTIASLHGLLRAPPADQQAFGPRSRSA